MKTKTSVANNSGSLKPHHIKSLVNRGYALHVQYTLVGGELTKVKDSLKTEAVQREGEHVPLADEKSTGCQWIAKGDECECRIVMPADRLKSEFNPSEAEFAQIQALSGEHFSKLFESATFFVLADKESFREQVSKLFKPEQAQELLKLCTSPSEPKAFFKSTAVGAKAKRAKSVKPSTRATKR